MFCDDDLMSMPLRVVIGVVGSAMRGPNLCRHVFVGRRDRNDRNDCGGGGGGAPCSERTFDTLFDAMASVKRSVNRGVWFLISTAKRTNEKPLQSV